MMLSKTGTTFSKHATRQDGPFGFRYYAILYAIEAPSANRIKIGRTLDMDRRFAGLQTASPIPLELLGSVWLPYDAESNAHTYLAEHRSHGEWFVAAPKVRELAQLIADKKVIQIASAIELTWMLLQQK